MGLEEVVALKLSNNKENKRITSFDVAELAGVSQATVSRVYNGQSKISDNTREKVIAAAKSLGYKPNAIARSLTSRRTNIIGIVTANVDSPFYSKILGSFTKKLQKTGRQVLLFNAEPNRDADDILSQVLQYQVDGLIITSATISSEMADECMKNDTPVVLFNRYVLGANASAVCCDNVESGRMVANFLLDGGHRKLAYISGNGNASTNIDRLKGFRDRLVERGITDLQVVQGDYSYESGSVALKILMESGSSPDAVFCANDNMALGAMDMARFKLGIRVPEDISIVGFDNIAIASWPSYSLTTVEQPIEGMIDATIGLLEKRIENLEIEPDLKLLSGKFVIRTSARIPTV